LSSWAIDDHQNDTLEVRHNRMRRLDGVGEPQADDTAGHVWRRFPAIEVRFLHHSEYDWYIWPQLRSPFQDAFKRGSSDRHNDANRLVTIFVFQKFAKAGLIRLPR
jgi:hypothetical protein